MSGYHDKKEEGVVEAPSVVCDHLRERPEALKYKIKPSGAEMCWFCYNA
jgi:hypothetical protein